MTIILKRDLPIFKTFFDGSSGIYLKQKEDGSLFAVPRDKEGRLSLEKINKIAQELLKQSTTKEECETLVKGLATIISNYEKAHKKYFYTQILLFFKKFFSGSVLNQITSTQKKCALQAKKLEEAKQKSEPPSILLGSTLSPTKSIQAPSSLTPTLIKKNISQSPPKTAPLIDQPHSIVPLTPPAHLPVAAPTTSEPPKEVKPSLSTSTTKPSPMPTARPAEKVSPGIDIIGEENQALAWAQICADPDKAAAHAIRSAVGHEFLTRFKEYIPSVRLFILNGKVWQPLRGSSTNLHTGLHIASGSCDEQELFLIDFKNQPVLQAKYKKFKEILGKPGVFSEETIMKLLLKFIQEEIFTKTDDESVCREYIKSPDAVMIGKDKRNPVIDLDIFVKSGHGVCRHRAAVACIIFGQLRAEGYLNGVVQYIRDMVEGGAHVWNAYTALDGSLWHFDAMWNQFGKIHDTAKKFPSNLDHLRGYYKTPKDYLDRVIPRTKWVKSLLTKSPVPPIRVHDPKPALVVTPSPAPAQQRVAQDDSWSAALKIMTQYPSQMKYSLTPPDSSRAIMSCQWQGNTASDEWIKTSKLGDFYICPVYRDVQFKDAATPYFVHLRIASDLVARQTISSKELVSFLDFQSKLFKLPEYQKLPSFIAKDEEQADYIIQTSKLRCAYIFYPDMLYKFYIKISNDIMRLPLLIGD